MTLSLTILAGFSLTALVLAALGLYAVVAFAVREFLRCPGFGGCLVAVHLKPGQLFEIQCHVQ